MLERWTQIYTPVTHSNGERLVQVTNPDGAFCGWADGRGKYDIVGTWEIDDEWSPEQEDDLRQAVEGLRTAGPAVQVTTHGIERHLRVRL